MPQDGTWQEQLAILYSLDHWWGYLARFLTIIVVAFIAATIGRYMVRRVFRYAVYENRIVVSERRARTLEALLSSFVSFTVILTAFLLILVLLGAPAILFPVLGLFSAGFGLGARPLVNDYLSGITLLFEYSYAFGEKVEILGVIGTVEMVGLRTTMIRADTGELYTVPNGDVRLIRNFSRGAFSPATVRVTVSPVDLAATIVALEKVADLAHERYGDELIARPEIISESGELGAKTQLTLVAKARFAHGAELRRQLMEDVHLALTEAGIQEVG
jgi:moderate conductance mechanosensitive channel